MTIALPLDPVADIDRPRIDIKATLEIRMLGPLQVRRQDGSLVDRSEWRTGKVADLLRLLALSGGEPVAPATLVAALWPGSDRLHGSASLRTAASQVRRVIGGEFLERSLAGLRLCDVWVDTTEFRQKATRVRQLAIKGETSAVNDVARQALALYRGDLTAHDAAADWVQNERRALAGVYQVLLCDASESAAKLALGDDAVDFASRAVTLDPFSERASRLLMSGHAAVGELSLALREYERCRSLLADELGTDPSPQTREVHLALLRGRPAVPPTSAAPRRSAVVNRLRASTLAESTVGPTGRSTDQLDGHAKSVLTAAQECLLRRDVTGARRLADDVDAITAPPALRARSIVIAWLPEVLLGGAREAREPLARATALARQAGDRVLSSRIQVLNCLVAHDIGAQDFAAHWAHAANNCELESDVNWAWLMMRIALERNDLDTAQLAGRLPLASKAGPLTQQLHLLAAAVLHAAQGEQGKAGHTLESLLAVLDRSEHRLLLPETLARLATVQAADNISRAEQHLSRLDAVVSSQQLLPREAHLRLIAIAAIHSSRGRTAAAAVAAARAAEIADTHGLLHLAAAAHELCADYVNRAQSAAARRHTSGSLRLTLSLIAV